MSRLHHLPSLIAPLLLAGACATPPQTPPRHGFARVEGTELHYEMQGSGPFLVLIQGGQLDARMWDDQFDAFARDYRVLRYDVRGFGRSATTGEPYQHHEDLRGLLDFLRIERAHLVGLSLGGRIAIDFALENPERVGAIVLSGPGLSGWPWSDDGSFAAIEEAARAGDAEGAAEAWLEHPYMARSMKTPEIRARLRELSLYNAQVWVRRRSELPLEPPAIDRLDEVRAPTLVLVGTEDVADIQRIVDALETGIPGIERVDVEGGGHMLNMEEPELFNRMVLEFLERNG